MEPPQPGPISRAVRPSVRPATQQPRRTQHNPTTLDHSSYPARPAARTTTQQHLDRRRRRRRRRRIVIIIISHRSRFQQHARPTATTPFTGFSVRSPSPPVLFSLLTIYSFLGFRVRLACTASSARSLPAAAGLVNQKSSFSCWPDHFSPIPPEPGQCDGAVGSRRRQRRRTWTYHSRLP